MYRLNPLKVRPRRLFLSSSRFSSLSTSPFIELVDKLKKTNKVCTVIESSCGGLISSSLTVPGSSKVYWYVFISCQSIRTGTSSSFLHSYLPSYHTYILPSNDCFTGEEQLHTILKSVASCLFLVTINYTIGYWMPLLLLELSVTMI